ncbi:hypothetical protein ILYODFUR_027007 [Ilyodon furcidens]|uniref:Uncharacterized protein n=1 Tax=Ilyodon furcidens TaxID=33524 RepID=A0ABV0TBE6_9TELE
MHHRGNVQFGRRTEQAASSNSWRLAAANPLFTVLHKAFLKLCRRPDNFSSARFTYEVRFGQSGRSSLERNNLNIFHFMKFGFVCVELRYLSASRQSAQHVLSFVFVCF